MYLMYEELARDRMRQVQHDAETARTVHRRNRLRREQRRQRRSA